jgi:hypothetical protein
VRRDPERPRTRKPEHESVERPDDDFVSDEPEHPGQTGPSQAETEDPAIGFEEEEEAPREDPS